ncbi:NADH-quinone oxidoreductase subunit J [Bacillus rubiinfantis]|uniref:NADH-quinone oxidoreductase subunit J n=1 Tax=Bacillus rubiinfantis TaxID=1499680 RepID=UPI0005AA9007|nr:NADH-quinone oxidoreductase subunit J [Bacillus rubiinfantis]
MTGEFFAFMALALVAISGGVLLLNLNKVVHMVVALIFTFVSIAGIYILLSAEFVAAVQVLIYSGAITIIMLFAIMLTKPYDESEVKTGKWRKFFVLLGVIGFAAAIYLGIYNIDIAQVPTTLHEDNTIQIGKALYTKYLIPFEFVSVLLLVSLIGAIILAKREDKEADEE